MGTYSVFSFIISLVVGIIFIPKLRILLSETFLVMENYKGNMVVGAMGLAFIFAQTLSLGIIKIFFQTKDIIYIYLLGFVFIGLLGFIDDTIGTDKYKGLKGHLGAFAEGELSTGNLKALLGGFIALLVSSTISENFSELILNGLFIALFINFMNLFDLRPGRASKVFLLISAIFLILDLKYENNYIIFSFYGILLPYIGSDLKGKVMMGDTGSNVLGFTLGFYGVLVLDTNIKIVILLILIILHLLAERVSFSKIIKNNRVLNFIDQIGR